MTRKKQKSGGAKLRDSGRKAILLGVAPGTYDRLKEAAAIEMRPLCQFVTFYALVAAQEVIKKHAVKDLLQQAIMEDRREL